MSKTTGNNRISALKRLGNASSTNNTNRRQLIGTNSSVNDARELLINRNKPSFIARQSSSKTFDTISKNIIVRKNLLQNQEETVDNNGKMVIVTGLKDMTMKDGRFISSATGSGTQLEKTKKVFAVGPNTLVTFRNNNNANVSSNQTTEKICLTKTITNASVRREDDECASLLDRKVVVSFVNDQYQKNPKPIQSTITTASSPSIQYRDPSPVIKRLHDASIQTTSSSSTRSPIRISSYRRHTSTTTDDQDIMSNPTIDDDDLYEPPVKRTSSSTRKTTANEKQQVQPTPVSTGSVKRTSTGAPVSSRMASSVSTVPKPVPTTQSTSSSGTILVTNLQPSVSEEDVIELFSGIGSINQITTLSQGCVQIVYAKREHAELAVARYHNRLLDGQFMYVSLQQTSSQSTTQNPKPTSNTQQSTKENGTSATSSSTANQPLKLNSTNNTSTKIVIDPAFIRQALFQPSNNTTNPVQFQVKL